MFKRWHEFFEGDTGRMSMTRLLCFLSFFPASVVVLATRNAETLGWYLGAFALSYVGGKTADIFTKPKEAANGLSVEVLATNRGGDPHSAGFSVAAQSGGDVARKPIGSGDS
jgi:hypothetical protein